jgi:aquaporin Z
MGKKVIAEFVGTFVLVFFGVGSAVFGISGDGAVGTKGVAAVGAAGVALAFGLVLLALAYAIGPVSGCHVNPAVTLAALLNRGITPAEAVGYVVAQVAGAIAGAGVLRALVASGATDRTGGLGTNDYGTTIDAGGAFALEVVLTFLLVFVVLLVTGRQHPAPGAAGLAIGAALTVIHLVGIPLTGTSVNPARSLGPAIVNGGDPLAHVWLFIVAPLVGAVVAWAVFAVVKPAHDRVTAADVDPRTHDTAQPEANLPRR